MQNLGTTHILAGELAKDYSKLSAEEKNKLAKTLFGIADVATTEATPKPTVAVSDHPISNTVNVLSNALSSVTDHAVTSDTTSVNTVSNAATSDSNVTPTDHAVTSEPSTVNVVSTTESTHTVSSDTTSVSSTDHATTANTVPNAATSDSNVTPTEPAPTASEPSTVSVHAETTVETKELTVSSVKVSTFYSDKAMKLPTELTAHVAEIDAEHGKVKLKSIGHVVPANTGVIVTGEPNTYTLTPTTEAAQSFTKNDLKGTTTGISASEITASSEFYYALSVNDGQPCFGVLERDLPAGKAYFTVPKSSQADTQFPNGLTISSDN